MWQPYHSSAKPEDAAIQCDETAILKATPSRIGKPAPSLREEPEKQGHFQQ
jgi:hypothetical protein